MKALKIIGMVVLAIVVIFTIVIAIQPSKAHIEKSILIHAPAAVIFSEVSNYKNFNAWSPWSKMDPEAKQTFEGEDASVGSSMSWDSQKTGKGSQWIEEVEPDKHVRSAMTFEGYDERFYSEFNLAPEADGTLVTWTFEGKNEGFSRKAMWIVMGFMLNSQYEQGLNDLKKLVENKATP